MPARDWRENLNKIASYYIADKAACLAGFFLIGTFEKKCLAVLFLPNARHGATHLAFTPDVQGLFEQPLLVHFILNRHKKIVGLIRRRRHFRERKSTGCYGIFQRPLLRIRAKPRKVISRSQNLARDRLEIPVLSIGLLCGGGDGGCVKTKLHLLRYDKSSVRISVDQPHENWLIARLFPQQSDFRPGQPPGGVKPSLTDCPSLHQRLAVGDEIKKTLPRREATLDRQRIGRS